jgi:hypothetical protein
MPTFTASVEVVHNETWEVDAADEAEARNKFTELTDDVIDDDSGGEVVDWTVTSVRKVSE